MSDNLVEIRCPSCHKLLFKARQSGTEIEIVCSKCKHKVYFGGFIFGQPVILDGTIPKQSTQIQSN